MNLKTVVKRSGETVDYDRAKIFNAITGANRDATTPADKLAPDDVESVTAAVETAIGGRESISVEEIQDEVEKALMAKGFFDVAKQFILYREKHAQRRNAQKKLMDTYRDIFFAKSVDVDLKRDNANINTDASMGIMLKLGAEGAKYFVDNYVLPEEFAAADKENWIHVHDKDFSLITLNCCQIDLLKLFHGGFSTGHGFLREPNSIRSYAALACIAIQSNQNDQFGGQSINAFDYAMAEGVRKSFKKILAAEVARASEFCDVTPAAEVDFKICTYSEGDNPAAVENLTAVIGSKKLAEKIYKQACRDVEEETHQAMEALIHNFNTLHCLPYSEKIWVFDTAQNELELTAVGELAEKFEPNRYQAISLNKNTGAAELKFITAIERRDNHRNLVTLVDNAGRRVTTTDNHKIMYLNNNGKILEDFPADITNVLAPRNFNFLEVSDKIFIDEFKSRKCQNYELPYISVTPEFAKIAGYYVAEGNVSGGNQLVFSVCSSEKEDELIALMKIVYGENITYNRYPRKNGSPHSIHFNVGKVMADAFRFYFGENSHAKKIPLEILFAQDRNVKVNFLNGYFKCDGSIKPRYARATSVSRLLIKQIHLMLLSLNELSTLNERDTHSAEYGDAHIYEINFCGNAGNRIGLEFNFENVRVEMRRYSYEFLKDLYYREFEGRRPHTPLSKNVIDDKSAENDKLQAASKNFSVPIKKWISSNSGEEYVYDLAVADNETFLTEDCIFVHNSRAGAQVPFSSINYGMDTSAEGRLAIREVLNAIDAGLGNGETPIFPISIFQLKAGINYNVDDPNYDLFRQACKVSAKRLFPNFLSLDAPYNLQYYKPGDYNSYVATMGCRTRVMSNVNGPEQSGSRGNFAFVTINLPKLALEAGGSLDEFFRLYDKYITICHDYLLFRLKIIEQKHVYNFPFLMGQGVWLGSDKLKPTDSIKDVLKHASYSIGFCGLAECLVALIGVHHGQSAEAQELGLKIVRHLRERTDEYAKLEQRNWTTFATPAESTAGQFQRANRKKYGKIKGVTDRDYMTNSSHVPVYFPITANDKIQIEAPYHALCNAGHIAYIEMDGDPTKNLSAFEAIVRAMHDANMGYFSINHPVDRDPVCGYTGIIANECPHCHRKEISRGTFHIDRLNH